MQQEEEEQLRPAEAKLSKKELPRLRAARSRCTGSRALQPAYADYPWVPERRPFCFQPGNYSGQLLRP